MANQQPSTTTGTASYSWQDFIPIARNVVSFGSGAAVAVGVMSAGDQASLIDALTHIGDDLKDIFKYLGIVAGIAMPVWAHVSSNVNNIIRALKRKAPSTIVVAPPAIAAVTPAESSREVTVVSKVSGQAVVPKA